MHDGNGELVDLEEPDDKKVDPLGDGSGNTYLLFTRQNRQNAQIIINGNVNSIRISNYNANRPLMVLVHGWKSDQNSGMNAPTRDPYLVLEDANVIVVDWSQLASASYSAAVRGVPGIGQHLARFLEWFINNGGGNWNRVHLVGHGMGAHVCGYAGRTLNGRVIRITGLDPAGPQFRGDQGALNHNDAGYVEIIHTNGGAIGIFDPSGDTDFYPDGGRFQPGCTNDSCSHRRAHELFAFSVRHANHFVGKKCVDLQEAQNMQCSGATLYMGNSNLNKQGTGLYGLSTLRN